jgi:hypothetical protein
VHRSPSADAASGSLVPNDLIGGYRIVSGSCPVPSGVNTIDLIRDSSGAVYIIVCLTNTPEGSCTTEMLQPASSGGYVANFAYGSASTSTDPQICGNRTTPCTMCTLDYHYQFVRQTSATTIQLDTASGAEQEASFSSCTDDDALAFGHGLAVCNYVAEPI